MVDIDIFRHKNKLGIEYLACRLPISKGFVYMQLSPEHSYVPPDPYLFVDSQKFLTLWQRQPRHPHKELAFGNKNVWRKDYKYHFAEEGFALGIENPVPLGFVHCSIDTPDQDESSGILNRLESKVKPLRAIPHCAFTDGITRTIWLLANGATCFPVRTSESNFELLKSHAGVDVPCLTQEI